MGKLLGIMLVLPVMGASFYGTTLVMQNGGTASPVEPKVQTLISANSLDNPALSGSGSVYRNLADGKNFAAVKLSKAALRLFAQDGRADRADMLKPVHESGDGEMKKLSSADLSIETAKALPVQLADTTIVNTAEKSDPLEEIHLTVMARKAKSNAVQLTAATGAPYRDAVDPSDFDTSILLHQATASSSWADGLVTSSFKTAKPAAPVKSAAEQQAARALTPRILPSGRAFGGFTEREFQKRELRCMATALYFEARSEPIRGQLAVGQVIMNRVRSPEYPDTICGVIFQGDHRRTGCQFSFACDGKADRPTNARLWNQSKRLARNLTQGKVWLKDIANSTHYHANYVWPKWRRSMRRIKKIGRHIFYKSPKISTTNTFQHVRS